MLNIRSSAGSSGNQRRYLGGTPVLRNLAVFAVITASLCLATTAAAAPIAPYNGEVPFRCETQNTGFGVDYPNPEADPFCVKYNKTNQNVRHLGIVDFLLLEPARVAAAVKSASTTRRTTGPAGPNTGSRSCGTGAGRYFFDKARGMGGVFLSEVRVLGQAYDPRLCPGSRLSCGRTSGPAVAAPTRTRWRPSRRAPRRWTRPRRSSRSTSPAGGTGKYPRRGLQAGRPQTGVLAVRGCELRT